MKVPTAEDLALCERERADKLKRVIADLETNPSSGVVTESLVILRDVEQRCRSNAKQFQDLHEAHTYASEFRDRLEAAQECPEPRAPSSSRPRPQETRDAALRREEFEKKQLAEAPGAEQQPAAAAPPPPATE